MANTDIEGLVDGKEDKIIDETIVAGLRLYTMRYINLTVMI